MNDPPTAFLGLAPTTLCLSTLKYRLVSLVHFSRGKVHICHVLAHQEYATEADGRNECIDETASRELGEHALDTDDSQ